MKLSSYLLSLTAKLVTLLSLVALSSHVGWAQGQYVQPTFSQRQSSQAAPPMPGALLAGGPAAAQGGQFMDVQGNPIVLQTNFCQSCPGGYGGYGGPCQGCPGGYGDPMAVDFGGYGEDQCGPHYFDVQVGTVFLQGEEFFEGLQPFTSAGFGSPDFFLDPANDFGEFEPGWEIAARYDIGALAVVEAAYMGMYDISFSDQAQSADVGVGGNPNALVSIFGGYGLTPIPGIDNAQIHAVDYQADLQSTEINYRRYWVGSNPRVSGTWLVGARYWRFTDDFAFIATALVPPSTTPVTSVLQWSGQNDMVGFHFGGDAWACLRQGLRAGIEGTAGIYNNRFEFQNSGTFPAATGPDDFVNPDDGNQVAFATEAEVSVVADILPSWSIRGGYRVLFLNSLATAQNNIDQSTIGTGLVSTQAGLLFHGFHGGLEYIW